MRRRARRRPSGRSTKTYAPTSQGANRSNSPSNAVMEPNATPICEDRTRDRAARADDVTELGGRIGAGAGRARRQYRSPPTTSLTAVEMAASHEPAYDDRTSTVTDADYLDRGAVGVEIAAHTSVYAAAERRRPSQRGRLDRLRPRRGNAVKTADPGRRHRWRRRRRQRPVPPDEGRLDRRHAARAARADRRIDVARRRRDAHAQRRPERRPAPAVHDPAVRGDRAASPGRTARSTCRAG